MTSFFAISLLIMLAAISPGPDFAMVVKNSLLYSRRAGFFTALGVASSLVIHASYCILGLALIISQSLLAFRIIKYVGAVYLFYIGVKSLLAKKELGHVDTIHEKKDRQATNWKAFQQGLLCNLLNPKAILFLLAFFTLVVKPGNSIMIELAYGADIAIIHLIWFSFLAYMLNHSYVKYNLKKVQFVIVKVMGAVLVGFAIRIATLHQSIAH